MLSNNASQRSLCPLELWEILGLSSPGLRWYIYTYIHNCPVTRISVSELSVAQALDGWMDGLIERGLTIGVDYCLFCGVYVVVEGGGLVGVGMRLCGV